MQNPLVKFKLVMYTHAEFEVCGPDWLKFLEFALVAGCNQWLSQVARASIPTVRVPQRFSLTAWSPSLGLVGDSIAIQRTKPFMNHDSDMSVYRTHTG